MGEILGMAFAWAIEKLAFGFLMGIGMIFAYKLFF